MEKDFSLAYEPFLKDEDKIAKEIKAFPFSTYAPSFLSPSHAGVSQSILRAHSFNGKTVQTTVLKEIP